MKNMYNIAVIGAVSCTLIVNLSALITIRVWDDSFDSDDMANVLVNYYLQI